MAYEALQAIVGTALVDSRFRARLLNHAPDVLRGFPLTPEESAMLTAIRARTFQGFVNELHSWISRDEALGVHGVGY